MAKLIAAQDCNLYYQTMVVFENEAAGWTEVICDARPDGSKDGAGSGAGAAVGSSVGVMGFALGLAIDGAGEVSAPGEVNPANPEDHAVFSSTVRSLPDGGLEATNWVLHQAWVVEKRQTLLRESFRTCAGPVSTP